MVAPRPPQALADALTLPPRPPFLSRPDPSRPARGKIQELRTELQQADVGLGGGMGKKGDKQFGKKKIVLKKIVANVRPLRPPYVCRKPCSAGSSHVSHVKETPD